MNSSTLKLTFCFLILTLFSLLRADEPGKPDYNNDVRVRILSKTSTNTAGQPIVYPHDGTPEVSIFIVEIPPGKQTGWHQHPVPLFGYVLEGEVTVELADGKKTTFKQGAPLAECVNMLHNGVNTGEVLTKLLIVVAGEKDVPFTKKAQ